jgi:DNA invertase Pin-like site-specific DNA recombinase
MAKGTPVTEEQSATIERLDRLNFFYSQIAKVTGLSKDTVSRHLRDLRNKAKATEHEKQK